MCINPLVPRQFFFNLEHWWVTQEQPKLSLEWWRLTTDNGDHSLELWRLIIEV
jgi:hypothetical protein